MTNKAALNLKSFSTFFPFIFIVSFVSNFNLAQGQSTTIRDQLIGVTQGLENSITVPFQLEHKGDTLIIFGSDNNAPLVIFSAMLYTENGIVKMDIERQENSNPSIVPYHIGYYKPTIRTMNVKSIKLTREDDVDATLYGTFVISFLEE